MILSRIAGVFHRGGAPREIVVHHPGGELFGSDRVMLEMASRWVRAERPVWVETAEDGPLLAALRTQGVSARVRPMPVLRGELKHPRKAVQFVSRALRDMAGALGARMHHTQGVDYINTQILPVQVLASRMAGRRTVLHIHEAEVSRPGWVRAVLALPALAADAIIANSEFTRDVLLMSWPRLAPKIHVVHNPVEVATSHSALPQERPDALRLLYVGRLSDRKGVDLAIRTAHALMQKHIPVGLDVVGSVFRGNESYEYQLREMVRELGLENVVTFHGFARDVTPFLERSHVVLVPSRKEESYGNVAVEAVLAGRFVAVSGHSGLLEATNGLLAAVRVAESDGKVWGETVQTFWDNWEQKRSHLEQDRQILQARHAPEFMASEAMRVIMGDKDPKNYLLNS